MWPCSQLLGASGSVGGVGMLPLLKPKPPRMVASIAPPRGGREFGSRCAARRSSSRSCSFSLRKASVSSAAILAASNAASRSDATVANRERTCASCVERAEALLLPLVALLGAEQPLEQRAHALAVIGELLLLACRVARARDRVRR